MNYFLSALKKSFNYSGRARRAEFGWFMLITTIISFVFSFLEVGSTALGLFDISNIFSIIGILFSLMTSLSAISLTTRRLHDLGYSGWWQLVWSILPLIFLIIFAVALGFEGFENALDPYHKKIEMIVIVFSLIFLAMYLVIYLILTFKDGQKFPNKYGESPKYPTQTDNQQLTV